MGIDQEISNPEVTGGNAPRVWMTRGGHRGEYEEPSFLEGTTGGGWTTIPNLSGCVGLEDYRDRVASVHPDKTKAAIRNWATQLAQLRDDMRVDDIVVMPRKGKRTAAVGRITSGGCCRLASQTFQSSVSPSMRNKDGHLLRHLAVRCLAT